MNAEADTIVLRRLAEVDELGLIEQRRRSLKTLKLRTVIKESHCNPVAALAFNSVDGECANIFATVGKNQATVYDDCHMGDYISVVVQFVNVETEHSQGGELRACAWLNTQTWNRHPQGDACLAVSGADANISIISIVESRVILQLKGHRKEVVGLATSQGNPCLLVSLSRDGELRIWNVPTEACIACVASNATALALSPDGRKIATGGKRGGLQVWTVPEMPPATVSAKQKKKAAKGLLTALDSQVVKSTGKLSHQETIDCVQFLDSSRLASKSSDGCIIITELSSSQQSASWKVPACSPGLGLETQCRFSTTADGSILCVGNSKGEIHVYETATGDRLAQVAAIKVSGPVLACGISEDCRHLLATMGNGFVFRFEAVLGLAQPGEAPDSFHSEKAPMEE